MVQKKVFVTGGSGFLGRKLLGMLRERGYTSVALARFRNAGDVARAVGAEELLRSQEAD